MYEVFYSTNSVNIRAQQLRKASCTAFTQLSVFNKTRQTEESNLKTSTVKSIFALDLLEVKAHQHDTRKSVRSDENPSGMIGTAR